MMYKSSCVCACMWPAICLNKALSSLEKVFLTSNRSLAREAAGIYETGVTQQEVTMLVPVLLMWKRWTLATECLEKWNLN